MRGWIAALVSLFVVLFALSVALLCMGVRVQQDAGTVPLIGGFTLAECSLSGAQVVGCVTGGYVAVWKRAENGASIVEGPFSVRSTMERAENDLTAYPNATGTVPCMCPDPAITAFYPNVECSLRNVCMLEVRLVQNMQLVDQIYGYTGATLLAIGSLTLVVFVGGMLAMLIGNCTCCGCLSKKKDDFYLNMQSTDSASGEGKLNQD